MIGAHPDDENTALLSALALERGLDVAYLSLTRGEGGQNGIGTELGPALGLLRSEELLAARRLDGARQFFTRAYDFGYSKNADEAFLHWPRDELLADVVAVVRTFRPDAIVSIFSGTPQDGHGQHQAAGIMARLAFEAAGDADRFAEQIERGLRPHAPAALYQALWRADDGDIGIATGTFDPLLGRSAYQVAMASRSRHRSQDMGQDQPPGPNTTWLDRLSPAESGGAATTPDAGTLDPLDVVEIEAHDATGDDALGTSDDGTPDGTPDLDRIRAAISLAQRARTLIAFEGESASRGVTALLDVLSEYASGVEPLGDGFNALSPAGLVPGLARALGLLRQAGDLLDTLPAELLDSLPGDAVPGLRLHLAAEAEDVATALARAGGLTLDAVADDERVVPGQAFELELTLWNGGTEPVTVAALSPVLPMSWQASPLEPASQTRTVAPGALLTRRFRVQVPGDAAPNEPYFLRRPRPGDLYTWPDRDSAGRAMRQPSADAADRPVEGHPEPGRPFDAAPVQAVARVELGGASFELAREAMYRSVHPQRGELRRPVYVVPRVGVALDPGVALLPLQDGSTADPMDSGAAQGLSSQGLSTSAPASRAGSSVPRGPARAAAAVGDADRSPPSPLHFTVQLRAEAPGGAAGTLRLELPDGWRAQPAAVPVHVDAEGERRVFEFAVQPPTTATTGEYPVQALFEAEDGQRFARGYTLVDYAHVRPRPLYRPAAASVRAFAVELPSDLRVAYIMGAGDDGPEAIRQLGLDVELLDAAALGTADLGGYDVIVTGIRAYEVRPDLVANNRRLLEYVDEGGTLIVQYNKYEFDSGDFAPYPLTMARPHDRVTDEAAPVEFVAPDHPVLTQPNRLTAADFEGWIQDRGLYFAHTWDERYTPVLAMSDPGEAPLEGGMLVARYGEGTYVYTGLAFFRQFPAGVPGAYRLFANLLALGAR